MIDIAGARRVYSKLKDGIQNIEGDVTLWN